MKEKITHKKILKMKTFDKKKHCSHKQTHATTEKEAEKRSDDKILNDEYQQLKICITQKIYNHKKQTDIFFKKNGTLVVLYFLHEKSVPIHLMDAKFIIVLYPQ